MATRPPPGELIGACIRQLVRTGRHIDVENVAEVLKATVAQYRRVKTNILIRQITPAFVEQNELIFSKQNREMNDSLCQLYKQTSTQDDTAPQSNDDTTPQQSAETLRVSARQRKRLDIRSERPPVKRSRHHTEDLSDPADVLGRRSRREFFPEEDLPPFTLDALGGVNRIVQEVRDLVIRPLKHHEVYRFLGASPITGVLLHGPPGSGKTKLALGTAGEAGVPFFKVSAPELITGISGESEGMLRSLFDAAKAVAPSLVFIDELDVICPKRETASREMERRIVAQLGTCIDDLAGSFVIVMGATNRAEALDPMIRRNGRFDREIAMGIPDETARADILRTMSQNLRLDSDVDFRVIGKKTPGFVGADLDAVTKEAALASIRRIFGTTLFQKEGHYSDEELQGLTVRQCDFLEAIQAVQPSAKREGFATAPDTSWDDVGGLSAQRKELEDQICNPIKDFPLYKSLGLDIPAGILLFGPPGCGKTLLAKAVAGESGANFISVKGPELLNKYVGESEKAIRLVFQRARMSAPCVIFFDELDSLCCRRGSDGGNAASERVVNQLLTEMDGVQDRRNVYVVAATNRPELIDPAMLRPGRLERLVCIPLPDETMRLDILRRLGRRIPLREGLDLKTIAGVTNGFSGADLAALLRQAVMLVLEEYRSTLGPSQMSTAAPSSPPREETPQPKLFVDMPHIQRALESVRPSVTPEHIAHYNNVYAKLKLHLDRPELSAVPFSPP